MARGGVSFTGISRSKRQLRGEELFKKKMEERRGFIAQEGIPGWGWVKEETNVTGNQVQTRV